MPVKYIKIFDVIILFPASMDHSVMAIKICGSKDNVQSAGFVNTSNWFCHGESVGLGIKSDPKIDSLLCKSQYQEDAYDL